MSGFDSSSSREYYSLLTLVISALQLLQKLKCTRETSNSESERQTTLVLYIHRISHDLKKVISKYHVNVVFSVPCKLSKICSLASNRSRMHVPGGMPLSLWYVRSTWCPVSLSVGQSGRCFNERAREHSLSIKSNAGGHLAEHCKRYGCIPEFVRTAFLMSEQKEKLNCRSFSYPQVR